MNGTCRNSFACSRSLGFCTVNEIIIINERQSVETCACTDIVPEFQVGIVVEEIQRSDDRREGESVNDVDIIIIGGLCGQTVALPRKIRASRKCDMIILANASLCRRRDERASVQCGKMTDERASKGVKYVAMFLCSVMVRKGCIHVRLRRRIMSVHNYTRLIT